MKEHKVVSSENFDCTDYTQVQMIKICEDDSGQRLDNFLFRHLKKVPKTRVYNLLRRGEIRVNKSRKKAEYRLETGDLIRLAPIKLVAKPSSNPVSEASSAAFQERLESWVVYQDQRLLIINKPPGLAVHGGSGVHLGLIELCRQHYQHAKNWELVHRLDRETSGLVMIAKKRSELRRLHQVFRDNEIQKEYWAILVGQLERDQHEVDLPLKKNQLAGGARIVKIDKTGQAAKTFFTVQARRKPYTFVLVKPITGRTHQIRVHAQSLGCPIIGDDKYADQKLNNLAKKAGFPGLMLHARRLVLPLDCGQTLAIEANPPKNMQRMLETFP